MGVTKCYVSSFFYRYYGRLPSKCTSFLPVKNEEKQKKMTEESKRVDKNDVDALHCSGSPNETFVERVLSLVRFDNGIFELDIDFAMRMRDR